MRVALLIRELNHMSANSKQTSQERLINQDHWEQRYNEGVLPWDSGITPPEVEAFWHSNLLSSAAQQGRAAVDLGCGTGTNLAYLARLGLYAIGIEVAGNAIAMAQTRLRQHHGDLSTRIELVQASVTALPLHNVDPIYMLDIGCFHAIHPDLRAAYAKGVTNLLSTGGYYHLYAFDWMEERANNPEKSPRGMREHEVSDLFTPALRIVEIQRAIANPHPCRWYLLQKPCL